VNEREFIRKIESLDAADFARALREAGAGEQRALRAYLGAEACERMFGRASRMRTRAATRGNVVVLHGIMGGELTEYETDAEPRGVWLRLFRILRGGFSLLPLANGSSVKRVGATGILKRYYGDQLLWLMDQGWNVHAFWFDWRLDVRRSADTLALRMREWFEPGCPVHLVAHSMGGLVARMFIHRHPDQWAGMWDRKGNGAAGGRLVMLGTPNHGSFAIPQLLSGLNGVLRKLALVDLFHSLSELIEVAKTFTGIYHMLPSPLRMPAAAKLYEAATYAPLVVEQRQLDGGRAFHNELAGDAATVDANRMVYVAGYGRPTPAGIRDWARLGSLDGYEINRLGDGTVPLALGLLDGIPTYYVKAGHGSLPCDEAVMSALDDILATGATAQLPATNPDARDGGTSARNELTQEREAEERAAACLAYRLAAAVRARGEEAEAELGDLERQAEDLILREFAGGARAREEAGWFAAEAPAPPPARPAPAVPVRIRVLDGSIADIEPGEPPVDAIAVGHYIGVRPAGAELALDEAISAARPGEKLLTSFAERGVLRGEAGQPFFLPDPRDPARLIAIAGLGYPGRCGGPELAAAVRELAWSLERLGKRHLAAVLIGSGNGNLPVREAAHAWIGGIRAALAQAEPGAARLRTFTFVENDPGKLLELRRALDAVAAREAGIDVAGPPPEYLKQRAADHAAARARAEVLKSSEDAGGADEAGATRLTVELREGVYRYGAITETASVPERRITLDPDLVNEANDALAGAVNIEQQSQLGQYLLKLLFPADLRSELATAHPLVITCDAGAARIHWEMIAQPGAGSGGGAGAPIFLGIHRGLTRQLRTPFALPPEPAPTADRILRVLIVADGARDASLPGAADEGRLVAELFKRFRKEQLAKPAAQRRVQDVEVTALIGPEQATRTRVMQELLLRRYDILHYAGHCVFDSQRPAASGWIFTGGKRLGANELSRVERVPGFVFANACESGVTPEGSGERTAELAPTFAESFFARGVRDFICTGWPVFDVPALQFAETFYAAALGLNGAAPAPVHAAMREARRRVSGDVSAHAAASGLADVGGRRSWGAYQHYGNPYTRLVAGVPADRAARAAAPR